MSVYAFTALLLDLQLFSNYIFTQHLFRELIETVCELNTPPCLRRSSLYTQNDCKINCFPLKGAG